MSVDHPVLDEIDRGILQLLQRDARNNTAVEIGERVGVSDGTVRNRIDHLETEGIIEGYVPTIDYDRAGYQLKIVFQCTARIVERADLAEAALSIDGVVNVREIMTGRRNVVVTAVAPESDDVTRVAYKLDDLGLDVEAEELMRSEHIRPFNHFGTEYID